MEYCLRRLKRCTILTEGRPHSWNSCSSLLHSYMATKCTLFHIVNCAFTGAHEHTEGPLANLLFKYLYAHTFLVHIAFVHYANMCREGGRNGGEENEKREGEHAEIKTAQLCCPQLIFTMIPIFTLAASLSHTDAHSDTCKMHTPQSCQSRKKSHTHTHTTTSSSQQMHTVSALTHLGRGKVASSFLSMS